MVANPPDGVPEPGRFRVALELAPDCPCKDAETRPKDCNPVLAAMIVHEAYCPLTPLAPPTNGPTAATRQATPMTDTTTPAPGTLTPAPVRAAGVRRLGSHRPPEG